MLTPSSKPELTFQLPELTTSSVAHPDTWNPTHQALLNNDAALHALTQAIAQAQQDASTHLGERLDNLELVSAVGTQKAVTLDWLYRRNTIQFELWQPGFTLTDPVNATVTSGVAGDDSLDLESTAGLKAGESYLLSAADKPTHLVKVVSVLNTHRVRVENDLPTDYTGGQLRRTTMNMTSTGAQAEPGDSWLSRKLQASGSSSVIIRMLLNAAKVRLFWRDDAHDWTESVWTARRAIEEEPGYSDFEYNVGGKGNCWLRLDVEGEPVVIKHLVVLGENTGLGGYVNQDAKPHTPMIIVPADASTDVTITPTLSIDQYTSDSGISMAGVRFQLATDAEFAAITHDSGWRTDSLSYGVPVDTLEHGETYHVRARVRDKALLESDWSAAVSFTTESAPVARVATPSIVAPASNALGVEQFFTIRLSLFQSSDTTTELTHIATQVQIRNASDRWADALWDSGAVPATQSVDAPGRDLRPDATYAIRARYQSDESGWSEWSADSAFTTAEQFASDVTGIALVPAGTGYSAVRIDEHQAQLGAPLKPVYFDAHPVFGGIYDALIHGQHMVRIPKFYYRREMITLLPWIEPVDSWQISPTPKANFELHPAFIKDGVEQAEFFVGKYVCSRSAQGQLQSVPGQMPLTSLVTGTSYNNLAAGLDTENGFDFIHLKNLSALQMLLSIEHLGFDAQKTIARGHVDGVTFVAVDDPACLAASYRGVTGLWGNIDQLVHQFHVMIQTSYAEQHVAEDGITRDTTWITSTTTPPTAFYSAGWAKPHFLLARRHRTVVHRIPGGDQTGLEGNRISWAAPVFFGGNFSGGDQAGPLALKAHLNKTGPQGHGYRLIKYNP